MAMSATASPLAAPPPAVSEAAVDQRRWLLHLVGFVGFVGAGYLGRSTVIDQSSLSLLWPAGGVAAAWLFFSPRRHRPAVVGVLGVSAVLVNATTGATAVLSVASSLATVGQGVLFLHLVRRRCPDLWGVGGDRPLAEMRALSWVTVSAAVSACVGVVAGELLLELGGGVTDSRLAVVWAGRNFAGLLSVFAIVHLVAYRWSGQARSTVVPRWEWVAMVVVTAGIYVPVFLQDSLPLTFVPTLAVLWVGMRSDAVVAASHALLGGSVVVALTLAGHGPFHTTPDLFERALLVQLFFTGVLVSGLYLSAAREERGHAARDLALERARVEEQSELLSSAFEHVSDALLIVGEDGEILTANPTARRVLDMIGSAQRDRVGGSAMRRPDGTPIPREQKPAIRALRGEAVAGEDVLIVDRDGVHRTLSVSATPLQGVGVAKVVATFRDVTDERAQVDELSAFAGVVAHDLRGPLAALQGWAELAQQVASAQPETAEDLVLAVERIRSSSARLSDLLEALLVHATSRDRELVREPVDLGELARVAASVRGIEARIDVRPVPTVTGDAVMLHHLVDNLVGNAVKYVADGVVPRVVVAGVREGRSVVVTVTDNGIGVPEDMRRAVFERFSRVAGTGRKGTGLGLSICRTIVERHGGEIAVAAGPGGQGSVFTVRLPAA